MNLERSRNELKMHIDLQSRIFSLTQENYELFRDFLKSSIFISKNGLNSLLHYFIQIIDYRPREISFLIDCLKSLNQLFPKMNIFQIIFNEITKNRPTCSRLYFIYKSIKLNLISESVIIPYVNSFESFYWLAPIIQRLSPQLFQAFINRRDEDLFVSFIEESSENEWESHDQYALEGMNHNEVARLIRKDDIKTLKKIPHFNINARLPSSPFESIDILNHGCTPLHYAAYFNSVKCYKCMLKCGASPFATDFNGFNVIQFAVAGNSFEILNELLQSNRNNEAFFHSCINQVIQSSIIYHENVLFDHFVNEHKSVINFSNVILAASTSNNLEIILKCINNKVDFNSQNHCGETPLIIASTNNHFELVKFLLSLPLTDQCHSDAFGRNALICAIDRKNLEIVKILIKYNKIDINSHDIS